MVSRVANVTFDTDKALKEFLDSLGGFKDHPFFQVFRCERFFRTASGGHRTQDRGRFHDGPHDILARLTKHEAVEKIDRQALRGGKHQGKLRSALNMYNANRLTDKMAENIDNGTCTWSPALALSLLDLVQGTTPVVVQGTRSSIMRT
jgi:hypothetical protein